MDELKKKIPDSSDKDSELKILGFFIEDGQYHTIEFKGKQRIEKRLSNFVGASLFHLVNGTNNSRRIVKIQRNTGQIYLIEVQSSEMKLEAFETILKSHQCTFFGGNYELKQIFAHWMDHETQSHIIETLGWNPEHSIYALSNAIFTATNMILKVDEVGIINDPDEGKKYYLPAFGMAQINNQDYEGDRKFLYMESDIDFTKWAKLYYDAFEANGSIGILFLILSVFWDIVFDQVGFFPFLFLFGAYGTGKTTMVEFLLRVFGQDYKGIPLNNATPVALSRTIASRNNTISYLKEYTPESDEANKDLILTAYDGSGRATGIKSNDNKTRVAAVKSALIFDGNHLPNQNTAILSRMVLVNFENNSFSEKQRKAYNELQEIQNLGFGVVLTDILQHREYFKKHFKNTFTQNVQEVRKSVKSDFSERTLKHVALMLAPAKILEEQLPLPFSYEEVKAIVIDNANEQNELLKQTDELTIFWDAFAYNSRDGRLVAFTPQMSDNDAKKCHFRFKMEESGETILQIHYKLIYPEYVKYCKNNNQVVQDKNTLKMLLTRKSYKPFIPSNQKGRGNTYTDKIFGSCYQFRTEKEGSEFFINDVSIKL